jgi:AcrR family transcriptional regulator
MSTSSLSSSAPVGRSFTMADVVALTGTAPSTVRYYIATGLVPPGRRLAANRFAYDERHVESLRLVRLLKERRRLPLEAIRRILPELLQLPGGGAFRPEMWDVVVETRQQLAAHSAPAARLLAAGVAAFDRHGYADARVDDVCQAAGVAKGSFYRHFRSKDELFFSAARAVAAEASASFRAVGGEPGGSLSPDAAVEALTAALEPHLPLLLDLASLAAQRRPGHGRVLREVFTELHRAARRRLDVMAAPERAEEVLGRALTGGIRRVVVSPLLEAELFPDETSTGYSPG